MGEDALSTLTPERWRDLVRTRRATGLLARRGAVLEITATYCDNPACSCEDVTLAFRELGPPPRQAGLAFDVHIDLLGDKDAQGVGLGAVAQAHATACADALHGDGRAPLRAALRRHRENLRRIPATIAGLVARGEMVPYAHVAAGGTADDRTYVAFLDEFDDEDGIAWSVLDFVCGAPRCACGEVTLQFRGDDDEDVTCAFDARVPLAGGPPSIENEKGITRADAQSLFADWEATARCDRAALKVRYDSVRRLAVEGAALTRPATARVAAPSRAVAASRVAPPASRRDPCPCGSGKRYKNCCGEAPR